MTLDEEPLSKQFGRALQEEIEKHLFERKDKDSEKPSGKKKSKDVLQELFKK